MTNKISHAQLTERLHGDMVETVEVSTCEDLIDRGHAIPKEFLDLEFDLLANDDDYLSFLFEENEEATVVAAQLGFIGGHLAGLIRKVQAGKGVKSIEGQVVNAMRGIDESMFSRITRSDGELSARDYAGLTPDKQTAYKLAQAERNKREPYTVGNVLQFLSSYYDQYYKVHSKEALLDFGKDAKSAFLDHMQSPVAQELVPDGQVREDMQDTASKTPLVVIDPLKALLEGSEFELKGMFNYDKRKAFVVVGTEDNLDEPTANARLLETAYHELLHACFVQTYLQGKSEVEDRRIRLFPIELEEVVVEKIAYAFMVQGLQNQGYLGPTELDTIPVDLEGKWRRLTGLSRPHILVPEGEGAEKAHKKSTDHFTIAYPEYRALIDRVFSDIDWKAGGLTSKEAEGLLANAVFARPVPGRMGAEKWPHRKEFFAALRRAKAAGVINRIGMAARTLGIDRVLDVSTSYGGGAISPDSLPHTKHFNDYQWRLNRADYFERTGHKEQSKRERRAAKAIEPRALKGIGLKAHIDTTGRRDYRLSLQPTPEEKKDFNYKFLGMRSRKRVRRKSDLNAVEKRGLEVYEDGLNR